ncbi:unnamed protein product [Parajaminaea phylloscopi]
MRATKTSGSCVVRSGLWLACSDRPLRRNDCVPGYCVPGSALRGRSATSTSFGSVSNGATSARGSAWLPTPNAPGNCAGAPASDAISSARHGTGRD